MESPNNTCNQDVPNISAIAAVPCGTLPSATGTNQLTHNPTTSWNQPYSFTKGLWQDLICHTQFPCLWL